MKVKFNIRVKDNLNGGHFEVGKTYEITDKVRIDKIVSNNWGFIVQKAEVITDEMPESAGEVKPPAQKGRKPKVEE